jgi:protein O-mannosyl-transferase
VRRWVPAGVLRGAAIVALAIASSATGIDNGFTYDDRPIIVQNDRVRDLANLPHVFAQTYWPPRSGPSLYRPLTILGFTLEWAAGESSPRVFHLTNIIEYAAVALAVFWLAAAILPMPASWIAAALFAVHPVHVEAVANVVGQSELHAAFWMVLAVAVWIRARGWRCDPFPWRIGRWLLVLYAIAFLSKEHGIMLPALLVAAELTVVVDDRPWRERVRDLRPLALAFAALGLGLLVLRTHVVGGFAGDGPNIVFVCAPVTTRLWTMVNVAGEWARLLVWPVHLVANYSPPMVDSYTRFTPALIPGAVVLVGAAALTVALWRRRPVAAFGLAWTAIALFPVSNVLIPSGVLLAERTLFLPSVGAMLALGDATVWLVARLRERGPRAVRLGAGATGLVLIAGAWKSASRQPVWRSNETLFRQTVLDAPLSYRAHQAWGGLLFERHHRAEGEREYRTALALYQHDSDVFVELADEYRIAGICQPAVPLYRQALELFPQRDDARVGLTACYLRLADWGRARSEAIIGLGGGRSLAVYRRLRGIADSALAANAPPGRPGRSPARRP